MTDIVLELSKKQSTSQFTHNLDINDNILTCNVYSSGLINDEYFIANFNFCINIHNNTINNIFFNKVLNKSDNLPDDNTENISFSNISNFENTFEQLIYDYICNIINNSTIQTVNNQLTIIFELSNIDYLVMNIQINNLTVKKEIINNELSEQNLKKENTSNICPNSDLNPNLNSDSDPSSNPISNTRDPAILKLIMWSYMLSFILHIFKDKIYIKSKSKKL